MKLTIFTDGASRGNPGQASYGFVIFDEDKNLVFEEGKYLGIQTNNFAEYSAVLASLVYVKTNLPHARVLNFFLDSQLVASQLSGKYKIKSENLIPLIDKIKKVSQDFEKINYQHIPRAKNSHADRLANYALDSR